MAVNREILFARVRDQLHAARICCDNGSFDTLRSVLVFLIADILSNTKSPSRVSERFFELISFHAKFTFSAIKGPNSQIVIRAVNRRRRCLRNLTTVVQKSRKLFTFICPLTP